MRANFSLFFLMVCVFVVLPARSELYPDNLENENPYLGNYIDEMDLNAGGAAAAAGSAEKRACIRRGGNCDHRPNDCCYNSSCRCNLWGSNCRCQRMGLFQKWG